jgi:hypothetical protein
MNQTRIFLGVESLAFLAMASFHATAAPPDQAAAIAESIIGTVLALGFVVSWPMAQRLRAVGLLAQGFALLGTLLGAVIITLVGTAPVYDIVFHMGALAVLLAGLWVTWRGDGRPVLA